MTPKKGASQKDIQEGLKKWNAAQEEMKNAKPSNKVVSKKALEVPPKLPVAGIDTPIPAAKTSATKKPDVAPSVKSTGMPRPAPSTPPAEKGLGAVGKTLSAKELMGIVGGPKLSGKASVMPKMSGPLASGGGGALSPDANTDLGRQMIAGARAKINDTTMSDDFIPRTPRTPLGSGGISGALQKLTSQAGTGMKKGGKTSCYSSGGSTSGASKRGDGIAIRGKTRGKIC